MSRVPLVSRDSAPGPVAGRLDQVHAAFGTVPAMFRALANAPAALDLLTGATGSLARTTLGPEIGERIAVAVANRNGCGYCLAAHTALGRRAGLSDEALIAAQDGTADDPRVAALLDLAVALVDRRGHVDAQDVQAVRDAGWEDEQVVEVIAHVAVNLFTNYVNIALDVPLDFPAVELRTAA
ncbi:carboxymuconolactone decarboxylase family protein [Cellulosimicrobium marinum]|uniref:carboxymuconolactone decarboxylase family protein n=1 Tax=Cellulosimicrobium marinum TaxID=1638992 RepID=UPI001E572EB9|nr:carboxymuconolactone decarboxylase family protein [Cellulosimicrobium marinum]MCB7135902.1 carboxymuconolactone decarboxylase family protein [Cellulosimicrobium marinum]